MHLEYFCVALESRLDDVEKASDQKLLALSTGRACEDFLVFHSTDSPYFCFLREQVDDGVRFGVLPTVVEASVRGAQIGESATRCSTGSAPTSLNFFFSPSR